MPPLSHSDYSDWHRIEREARDQVSAELVAAETTPLEYGHIVAWAEARFGRTNDVSLVHRVGVGGTWSQDDYAHPGRQRTLCGEAIPAPKLRLPVLSPAIVRALGRCRYCEHEFLNRATSASEAAA